MRPQNAVPRDLGLKVDSSSNSMFRRKISSNLDSHLKFHELFKIRCHRFTNHQKIT
jgi:hypothetical protein